MRNKVLIVLGILILLGGFLYGLHIRIVTTDTKLETGCYTDCNTIELHNLKLEKRESNEDTSILCNDKITVWWAI